MECLKLGLDIFLKRSIQTSIVNSHTVTYKLVAPVDNPAQLDFNCSGHNDYYIDLNSVRVILRIKLTKTDESDIDSAKPNSWLCQQPVTFNVLFSQFSLNRKHFTLHESNYHYTAYLEKLINYSFDTSGTHLISSF